MVDLKQGPQKHLDVIETVNSMNFVHRLSHFVGAHCVESFHGWFPATLVIMLPKFRRAFEKQDAQNMKKCSCLLEMLLLLLNSKACPCSSCIPWKQSEILYSVSNIMKGWDGLNNDSKSSKGWFRSIHQDRCGVHPAARFRCLIGPRGFTRVTISVVVLCICE